MAANPTPRITRLLHAINNGKPEAVDDLLPAVYHELRQMASSLMQDEAAGHTLQPTALVHEAYLRLVDSSERSWESRRHFFNAASMAMRRVLVDRARRVGAIKRGGDRKREVLDVIDLPMLQEFAPHQMGTLDDALSALGEHNQRWLEVVQLRFFAGLTIAQAAETLQVSLATVKADWQFARAWLKWRLKQDEAR